MIIKYSLLFLILLTYLSGTFSISLPASSFLIEIKFIFAILIIILCIIYLAIDQKVFYENISTRNMGIFFTLFTYFIFSSITLYYSPVNEVVISKYIDLIFLLILVMLTYFIVFIFKENCFFSTISIFFILVGLLYSLPVLISIFSGAIRGDVGISGPNVTTRIFFFALCSSLYFYNLKQKPFFIILIIYFIFNIIFVGSRGGIVALFVSTVIYLFIVLKNNNINIFSSLFSWRILIAVPFIFSIFYILYDYVIEVFINRFLLTTFTNEGIYTSGRTVIYTSAINLISKNPVSGNGIGSFEELTGYVYPHNLMLEMMVEIGVGGLIIFLIFLVYSIIIIIKLKNTRLFVFSLIPFYMIMVQMLSGQFYDFRYYFLLIIPLLYFYKENYNLKTY